MWPLLLAVVSLYLSLVAGETKAESFRKDLKAVESLVPLKYGNHVFCDLRFCEVLMHSYVKVEV